MFEISSHRQSFPQWPNNAFAARVPTTCALKPVRNERAMKDVCPNPSVKPTRSGLRPPRAAYLKRSASLKHPYLGVSSLPCKSPLALSSAERSLFALARPMRFAKSASQPSEWAVRPPAASAPVAVHHRHRLWLHIRMRVVAPLLAVSNSGVYSLHLLARQP